MKLYELFKEEELAEMLAAGMVRRNPHPTLPLATLGYTEQAVFSKTWNTVTTRCRGLIYDTQDLTVLARPLDKFFNLGEVEEQARAQEGPVEVTDKMDGSLGIGYCVGGRWSVATRGSFASDQAIWATKWLNETYPEFTGISGMTAMWEIIYPSNRIVLDYHGFEGLVLLGWRVIKTGEVLGPEFSPESWRGHRTEVMSAYSLAEAIALPSRENAEGVVVRWKRSGFMVKIKEEEYVRAHAVVTGMTNRSVWEILKDGFPLPEKASFMPDEFFSWILLTADRLQREQRVALIRTGLIFLGILEAMEDKNEAGYGRLGERTYDRKTFAGYAKDHPEFAAALFMKYDGQDERLSDWAWAKVRPAEIERPWSAG